MRKADAFLTALIAGLFILSLASCGTDAKKEKLSAADSLRAAIADLGKSIERDPDHAGLYFERSGLYMKEHSFDLALTDIRKAVALDGRRSDYYLRMADIYLLTGQPQPCSEALDKAYAIDPRNNDVLNALAKFSLVMKDYPKTYTYVTQALAVSAVNPKAHFTRAIALLEEGDTSHAVGDLMLAVEQDQAFFEAYVQLGDLYAMKNDPMAPAYYDNALKVKPADVETLYKLGMYQQDNAQFDKAIQTYGRIIQADSTNRNAPYNIGYIYLVFLNDFNNATKFFTQAIEADPDYFEAWYNRGYAYELLGNTDDAYRDYRQALKISVNYQKAIDGLNRLDAAQAVRK